MSETVILELSAQVSQLQNQIKGLHAQLNAHQQMVNEGLASGVQLRSNVYLLQQALQEVNQDKANAIIEKDNLAKENEALLARVTALDSELAGFRAPPVVATED